VSRSVIAFTLAVLVVLPIAVVYAAKPGWVAAGKYAEYEIYVEGNALDVNGKVGSVRIEFKSVSDSSATVVVSVSIDQQIANSLRSIGFSLPTTGSEEYTWNYEYDLGIFVLGSKSLEELSKGSQQGFSVTSESKSVPAGRFDCYKISFSASLFGASASANLWYEKSTGLLVAYEYSVQMLGQGARVSMQLKSTNIIGFPLTTVIVVVVVIAAVAAVAVFALRRLRRAVAEQVQQQIQTSTPQTQPQ